MLEDVCHVTPFDIFSRALPSSRPLVFVFFFVSSMGEMLHGCHGNSWPSAASEQLAVTRC